MVLSSSVLIEITSSSKEGLYLLAFGAQPTVQGVFAKGNAPSQWKTRSRDIFKRGKAVQYVDGATLSTNSSRVEFAPTTPVHSSRTPQGSFVHASRRLHRAHPPPSWALVRVPRRSFTRWSVVVHGVATIVPPLALQAREISSEPSPRGRLNRLCVRCFFSPFILAVSSGFRSDELQSLRRFPARPSARGASPLRRLPSCVPPFPLLSLPSLRSSRGPSRLPLWWLALDSSVREGNVAEASTVRAPERVCASPPPSHACHTPRPVGSCGNTPQQRGRWAQAAFVRGARDMHAHVQRQLGRPSSRKGLEKRGTNRWKSQRDVVANAVRSRNHAGGSLFGRIGEFLFEPNPVEEVRNVDTPNVGRAFHPRDLVSAAEWIRGATTDRERERNVRHCSSSTWSTHKRTLRKCTCRMSKIPCTKKKTPAY